MAETANVQDWLGRTETVHDQVRSQPARFMQATLDRAPSLNDGDPLPPLWHWLYFLQALPMGQLGRDAHPKKGGFLPPVDLPRRMWAGGRFEFHAPLILGHPAERRSEITAIAQKTGRSGPLCFVTVQHQIFQNDALALIEDHDIVFRQDPQPDAPAPTPNPAPTGSDFSDTICPTEAMLFRYSALTFNGHRIHYDKDYARQVEGYDGLVFHGPLTATLLVDLAVRQIGRPPAAFTFRALAPIAGPDPFHIEGTLDGRQATLWARRRDGALAMTATADF